MPRPLRNLLTRLHKWASRQDENFVSEVFAFLLQQLLEEEPEAAVRLLNQMTNGFFNLTPPEAGAVEVRTQVVLGEGRPDLEIRTSRQLAYIEVKVEAEVNLEQLARYRRMLGESGAQSTALVLLTRYPITLPEADERPDFAVRWFQIAEWINEQRGTHAFKPVSGYLVEQFLDFLGEKNMIMEQVTWELAGGIRALRTLVDMLLEAAAACAVRARQSASPTYMGIELERPRYCAGIYFDRPEFLVFETHYQKVDPALAARLGVAGVYEWESEPGHGWRRELSLESEEVHFFARSKASQLQLLENFLRECLTTVRQIEIKQTEPIPAPDESA